MRAPSCVQPHARAPCCVAPSTRAPCCVAPHTRAPCCVAPSTKAPCCVAPHTRAPCCVAPHTRAPSSVQPHMCYVFFGGQTVAPQQSATSRARLRHRLRREFKNGVEHEFKCGFERHAVLLSCRRQRLQVRLQQRPQRPLAASMEAPALESPCTPQRPRARRLQRRRFHGCRKDRAKPCRGCPSSNSNNRPSTVAESVMENCQLTSTKAKRVFKM
eukprot:363442-Chlamydomonas_euryale.AAC.3